MTQTIDDSPAPSMARRRVAALVVLIAIGGGIVYWISRPAPDELLRQAKQGYERGEYAQAVDYAERVLEDDNENTAALVLAGDSCFELDEFDRALGFYRRVPRDATPDAVHAMFRCGRIEFHHVGDTARAEASFRAALKHAPDNRNGLYQLISILGIQSRRSEAVPLILRLFRLGVFKRDFHGLLESDNVALFNIKELKRYEKATPDHPGVLIGLAWHAKQKRRHEAAARLLKRAVAGKPAIDEAPIQLAILYWETRKFAKLRALLASRQSRAIDDSRLWVVRGQLAQHDGDVRSAARCYWEAWKRNPVNRIASYQLYRHLNDVGKVTEAAALQRRIDRLRELRETADIVSTSADPAGTATRKLVDLLESFDRLWEAWGWCKIAQKQFPDADWPEQRERELKKKLATAPLQIVCRTEPPIAIDLSQYPLPKFSTGSKSESGNRGTTRDVSFRDDAGTAGLRFQYFNSPSAAGKGQRMYEFNGGGCGVLDFDRDGRPDLHLTQGCRWPAKPGKTEYLDKLFRNLGDGRFADVTAELTIREDRFSTGVAVGDFDGDGFPDLYIANIGRNRLYQNNGDGTFRDITVEAGVDDPGWSTSCVMADLNGDGLADVYSVNYLEGESVFERICRHDDGHPRMCMPFHFPGAQDQLYLNLGNGRFSNTTDRSGIRVANGKGLGVVAADFNGSGRLSLFVANDTVANFLFINGGNDKSGHPQFQERGLASGVAVNRDGRAEGCMGIAVGDANDDGRLDMYVTNFLNESNTLYLGKNGALFEDATRQAGLDAPSRRLLGFGTQFLDADGDGRLDLLVANGHIDDYSRYGRPYKMAAQLYYNAGRGRFAESTATRLGPYFRRKLLGRGMSRLDWNGDGREDAVISHLDAPVALLTNTTKSPARSLTIRLCGVQSARDAIGATVTVQAEHRTMMRQLTAGDGYQASNERILNFGLNGAGAVQRIVVRWPTGKREEFTPLAGENRYLIVEQLGRLLPIP